MSRRPRPNEHVGHNATHMYYGLTCTEFDQLVLRAEGRCERCGNEMRLPDIDRDHQIGRSAVRGLVCHQCNIIVSTIERGQRAEDETTTSYLGTAFHHLIPVEMPGYRPIVLRDTPTPSWDRQIKNLRRPDLVTLADLPGLLNVSRDEARVLVLRGKLIGVRDGDTCYFRRAVVERHSKSGSE